MGAPLTAKVCESWTSLKTFLLSARSEIVKECLNWFLDKLYQEIVLGHTENWIWFHKHSIENAHCELFYVLP